MYFVQLVGVSEGLTHGYGQQRDIINDQNIIFELLFKKS